MNKQLKKLYYIAGILIAIVAIIQLMPEFSSSEGNIYENISGNIIDNKNGNVSINEDKSITFKVKTIINNMLYSTQEQETTDNYFDPVIRSESGESHIVNTESNINVPEEGRFIYDEDFSLVGKVIEKPDDYGRLGLEGGISRIDIPDDGDKYYRIKVTTFDRESEASLSYYYTYDYEYKEDKFSDFTTDSGEYGGELEDLNPSPFSSSSKLGRADKMRDINTTIYVRPNWDSNFYFFGKVEPRLIDSNLFVQLKMPFHSYGKEVGDTLTAHGHITIEEIDKEESGNYEKIP